MAGEIQAACLRGLIDGLPSLVHGVSGDERRDGVDCRIDRLESDFSPPVLVCWVGWGASQAGLVLEAKARGLSLGGKAEHALMTSDAFLETVEWRCVRFPMKPVRRTGCQV